MTAWTRSRRRLSATALAMTMGAAALVASPVRASAPPDDGTAELLVRFAPGVARSRAASLVAGAGGRLGQALAGTRFTAVDANPGRSEHIRQSLLRSGAVLEAEPNRIRRALGVPNDPAWSAQSGYLQAVGLPGAWDITTGDDNRILAVLDSGIDSTHPEFLGRLLPGYDIVNGDTRPDDDYGHGTMVAGVAAARTNNGSGVAGASWRGRILPVKVIDGNGQANDADIAAGIVWATDSGADVINLSLGGPGASSTLQEAIDYATARNVVVVAAAGNGASNEPNFPAAARNVIAVGASDPSGIHAEFSNFGYWIDVTAPGTPITTTVCRLRACPTAADSYGVVHGTSFSAPLVSGIALLIRSVDPTASPAAVTDRLRRSARDLGTVGFDTVFGAGMVNAEGALRLGALVPAGSGGGPRPPGYWMLTADGSVYPFGSAPFFGEPGGDGIAAADIEPTPSGRGHWLITEDGGVYGYGDAVYQGGLTPAQLAPGERVTAISSTPTGNGYWIFTTRGRAVSFGDAGFFGDLRDVPLNGPVLDAIPTPGGHGYYMVGSDGGVFAFGDALFLGSMGATRLNAPVMSLVPDPDGRGYWLVAEDGGIFAFEALFRGSMGDKQLNAPVTGMVAAGAGYLMVAVDGGIFDFSGNGFAGSLGSDPPLSPVVAVAVMPR